jgi:sec-independent protein translocase protein TatA
MPGIGPVGGFELIIILVIVVLIFGVGKLPEVGGAVGRGIREFKQNVSNGEEAEKKAGEDKPKA